MPPHIHENSSFPAATTQETTTFSWKYPILIIMTKMIYTQIYTKKNQYIYIYIYIYQQELMRYCITETLCIQHLKKNGGDC